MTRGGRYDEAQAKWPEHFDATSSHRFRHSDDMQFALTYMAGASTPFTRARLFNFFFFSFSSFSLSNLESRLSTEVTSLFFQSCPFFQKIIVACLDW